MDHSDLHVLDLGNYHNNYTEQDSNLMDHLDRHVLDLGNYHT